MAFESDHGLLFKIKVQLIVSYTTIKVQVIFEMLLVLVASQFAIIGQLEGEIHL